MIRLFIVDDHPIVARGLCELLGRNRDIEVVGSAVSFEDAIAGIVSLTPDVVVQDVHLGDRSGVDVMREVLRQLPATRFLMFTVMPEDAYALDLITAGACGFLNKNAPVDEMVEAILAIHRGKKYYSNQLRLLIKDRGRAAERTGIDALSTREREIFLRLASGRRQIDVSAELRLSHGTLSTYVARIHRKLGTSTLGDLIRIAAANKLSGL